MKKWNSPAIEELNINETANGLIPFCFESLILFDDPNCDCEAGQHHDNKENENVTPDENESL